MISIVPAEAAVAGRGSFALLRQGRGASYSG
jgi:hypothetical protein